MCMLKAGQGRVYVLASPACTPAESRSRSEYSAPPCCWRPLTWRVRWAEDGSAKRPGSSSITWRSWLSRSRRRSYLLGSIYPKANRLCVLVFLPVLSADCGNNIKVNRKLNPDWPSRCRFRPWRPFHSCSSLSWWHSLECLWRVPPWLFSVFPWLFAGYYLFLLFVTTIFVLLNYHSLLFLFFHDDRFLAHLHWFTTVTSYSGLSLLCFV